MTVSGPPRAHRRAAATRHRSLYLQTCVDSGGDVIAFWSCGSPQGSDIYYAAYQPSAGGWSIPQQLTADLDPEKMLTAGLLNSQVICAYLKTEASVQDQPETMPDGSVQTVHEVVLGNSDLYTLTHAPYCDLELDSSGLSVSPAPSPGASVTLSATPLCWGDTQQTTEVTFYNGDPSNGGTIIGGDMETIPAGGTAVFSVDWTLPSTVAPIQIFATVDPDYAIDEASYGNNTAYTWIFAPDIAVRARRRLVSIARHSNGGAIAA